MADQHNDQSPPANRKRAGTAASVTQSIASFTEDVLNRDPAPGFIAATAQATSKAPTLSEIRRGSFGDDGWGAQQHGVDRGSGSSRDKRRSWSGSSLGQKGKKGSGSRDGGKVNEGQGYGGALTEPFAPLTEEPTRISEDVRDDAGGRRREEVETVDETHGDDRGIRSDAVGHTQHYDTKPHDTPPHEKHDYEPNTSLDKDRSRPPARVYSSGYIPPPTVPWTTSTGIALKGFGRWFITPFGFFVTLYGLNVVAWGGMLFLLLCNASPAMCHAPVPTPENDGKRGLVAALDLPGPYYFNCNDINAPRRIWIEIDSQILNALFCVTGFGLVPWRFRDLYYNLRYRFASTQKQGLEGKMYGLRVLAGIHRGWFRLPGSETLDTIPSREYHHRLEKETTMSPSDLESSPSGTPERDLRLPTPLAKSPADPITSVRAPPTKIWLMDFFIWCQVWNTFFQCCLCGFMWGQDRYDRPPWSTGLFVALACIIAGVGGVVSFVQGKRVKRVEGVAPSGREGEEGVAMVEDAADLGLGLRAQRTNGTGRESSHVGGEGKEDKGRV